MIRFIVVMFAAALLSQGLTGCGESAKNDAAKVGEGLSTTWDAVKHFAANRKDEAVVVLSKGLDGAESAFEAAKLKASELGGDAKDSLAKKWQDAKVALEKAKGASGNAWESARDKMGEAMNALKEKMKEVQDK